MGRHSVIPEPGGAFVRQPSLSWLMFPCSKLACSLADAILPRQSPSAARGPRQSHLFDWDDASLGLVLSCLIRATGWADAPRWGRRLRCWLATPLPLPQQWTCSAVQIVTRVPLSLYLGPRSSLWLALVLYTPRAGWALPAGEGGCAAGSLRPSRYLRLGPAVRCRSGLPSVLICKKSHATARGAVEKKMTKATYICRSAKKNLVTYFIFIIV
jgi:hypothetical protein